VSQDDIKLKLEAVPIQGVPYVTNSLNPYESDETRIVQYQFGLYNTSSPIVVEVQSPWEDNDIPKITKTFVIPNR